MQSRPAPSTVEVDAEVRAALAPRVETLSKGCGSWTGRELGTLYEALLAPDARRRAGIYYTPAPVVDSILDATLAPLLAAAGAAPDPLAAIRSIRVLDPACGAGYFLVAAAQRIATALAASGSPTAGCWAAACECVYGVDSDPIALDLTAYGLYLAGPQPEAPDNPHSTLRTSTGGAVSYSRSAVVIHNSKLKTQNSSRLHLGDALGALPEGWAGFDAVVGNPPYISHRAQPAAQKSERRARYRTARGQYDLSVLFVERGLELLRPGGLLGYILPNKFMAAEYGGPLRAMLAEETALLRLDDLSAAASFPGTAAYPVILAARKGQPERGHRLALGGPGRDDALVAQAAYCGLDGRIMPAAATAEMLALAERIARQPSRLPAGAIRCGVARPGYSRAAISAAEYSALTPAEQAGYMPLLQAQDIGPNTLRRRAEARYLPRSAMSGAQWAAFCGPSVVVPGIARRLTAAHTEGGRALGRVYCIADGATPYPPDVLIALLNSRLLGWYYRFLYWPVHLSGGYLRFNGPYLARLPLPPPEEAAPLADMPQHDRDEAICRIYGVASL